MLMLLFSFGQMWAEDVTISYTDIPDGFTATTGTSGSFSKTVSSANDLTINYSGINTKSSAGAADHAYGYAMFLKNYGYVYSGAAPDGYYPSNVVVTFGSNTGTSGKAGITYGSSSLNTRNSSVTGAVAKSGTCSLTNSDPTKTYWNFSTTGANVQVDNIVVTYTSTGGTSTCATPTFTPAAGSYEGTQNVTITSTEGATIYYTTDGSTPTTGSSVYSSAIPVAADMTIKAFAVKSGYDDSDVATAAYEITEGPDVTLDLVDGNWGFPTSNATGTETYTNSVTGYSVTCYAPTNYKVSGSSYFYLGKSGAYIELPSFSSPIEKIVVTGNSGASTAVIWNIFKGDDAVSTAATGSAEDSYTFNIAEPEANVVYTLKVTSAHNLQIKAIKIFFGTAPAVAKPTISGDENFVTSTTVTISHADADHIYYTTDGTDPTTSSTLYEGSFSLNATATVKAIAVKGSDESQVAEKTFTKGTKLSVAAAIALIPNNNDTQDNQFVEGYVCTAGTSVSSGQMTYYISDDGTETNRLQIYKGKNLNNTNFSVISDLGLQDKVVVFGQLKNYSGTPEMNSGNYIVERVAATVATPTFTPDGGGFLTTQSVTLACTTDGAEIRYTTDGSDPTELSTLYSDPIELSATTTITAAAFKGGASSSAVARTFTKGTKITVADALLALDSNDPIENQFVYGKVSTASTGLYSGKLTYYISDDGSTTNQLEVYNGYGLNGAVFTDKTDLQVGDEVTVYGTLTIHNTTKEFAAGSYLLEFNRPTVDLNAITLPATANVKVGKTVTLTPTFDPTNATDKTVSWTSDDELIATVVDGVVTGVAAGTADITVTYTADPTIKATCAVTVSEAPSFDDPTYEWQLVTSDAQLVAGKYYVIASDTKGKVASAISSDVLGTETAVFADGAIAYNAFGDSKTADASDAIVFELGGTSSAWTLTEVVDGSGLLGYKADKKVKWGGDATTWTISIADNNATIVPIDANTYHILYNVGSPRFTVYASDPTVSMLLPQLYVWTLKTYKLRYDANGGEDAPATQAADGEGKATVTTAIPTAPTDKIFERWNTLNDGLGTDKAAGDVIDLSTADVTLYAIWRDPVDNITISYDANGGEGSIDADADQVEGTQYTIKANAFTREGYSFAGWKAYDASDNELTITSNKITVPSTNVTIKAQWGEITVTDFVLVTDVNQLKDGDKVYIVAAGYDRAMGTQNTNYRNEVEIGKVGDFLSVSGIAPVEFTLGKNGDDFTFYDGAGYLYASSSSSNYIDTEADLDANNNGLWDITINSEGATSIVAKGSNTHNILQYNSNNPRFSCYGNTGQKPVVLYKKANYTRTISEGRYGTICLPKAGIMYGAEIYEIAYYGGASQKIFMDEIPSGEMVAGTPYIFLPKEGTTKLAVVYTDAANAPAGSHNGLIGSYSKVALTPNAGNYILLNNQYCLVESTVDPVYVGENKAYIKMSDITPVAPALKPGAKRVGLGVAAPQTPTDVDNLNATDAPVKVMINGQMYIIRGEKMYNANGQLVK